MDETDTPQNRSNDDAESKSSDENVSSEKKNKKKSFSSFTLSDSVCAKVSFTYNYGEKPPATYLCEMSLHSVAMDSVHF